MKFFDYCATQYAVINHQMQVEDAANAFDLKKQAQTKATHELIETQRKWFKFTAKFYFVFDFFVCHLTGIWPLMPLPPKQESKPTLVKDEVGQEVVR